MSTQAQNNQSIEECVRASLESYFSDLGGEIPSNMYDMVLRLVEKPLLDEALFTQIADLTRAG